jgi:KaiC/GvpD/RAD55 family RecA-like ATPase
LILESPWCRSTVCYRLAHAEDRARLALAFVLAGLRRGEKVLYLAAREDTGAFATQLAGDDRLASAMNAGQLEMRDARDAYRPARLTPGRRSKQ